MKKIKVRACFQQGQNIVHRTTLKKYVLKYFSAIKRKPFFIPFDVRAGISLLWVYHDIPCQSIVVSTEK